MIARALLTKVLAATLMVAAPAFGAEPPESVGKIRLRMTDEEARQAFPGITIKTADSSNSTAAPPFHYGEAMIEPVDFGELKGCKARLRFFQHQLLNINTLCPDKAATEAYLRKTLGEPTANDKALRWQGAQRIVTYSSQLGSFDLADRQLTESFNAQLLALVMQARGKPAAAGSPVATPATTPAAQP